MAEEITSINKSDVNEGLILGLGAIAESLNKMNLYLEKHDPYMTNDDASGMVDEDYDDDAEDAVEDEDMDYNDDEDIDDEELAKAYLMKRGYSFKGPIKKPSSTTFGVKNPVGRPKKTIIYKEDDDDKEDEDEKMEKMVASVTKSVIKQLMELNADKEHKVSGGDAWPMSSRKAGEDKEEKITPRTKTEEVQKPIVASEPILNADNDDEDKEHPVVEDEKKEKPVLKQTLLRPSVEKELVDLRKSMDERIEDGIRKGVADELKRKGWHVEQPTAQKNLKTFGAGEMNMLRKSETENDDVTDELKDLSWGDLFGMKFKQMAENNSNLPTDVFLKSISGGN